MSVFENAHHFEVNTLNVDARVYQGGGSARSAGNERRKAVQEDIISWTTSSDTDEEPSRILWLTGPAGAGKTAIAGAIAEICDEGGLLGAAFFSSRSGSAKRSSKRCPVTTLAHQIRKLGGYEAFLGRIVEAAGRNAATFNNNVKGQPEPLVLRPLREVRGADEAPAPPRTIVIDGADEVSAESAEGVTEDEFRRAREADQLEVPSSLFQAAAIPPSLPVSS